MSGKENNALKVSQCGGKQCKNWKELDNETVVTFPVVQLTETNTCDI